MPPELDAEPTETADVPEAPAPPEVEGAPIRVTEEMSPTYKRSVQKEKIKASARKRRKKKEENEEQ